MKKSVLCYHTKVQPATLNKWIREGKYPSLISMLLRYIKEEDFKAIDYDIMPCVPRADVVKIGIPIRTQDSWIKMPKDSWQHRWLIVAKWAIAKGWVIV